MTPEAIASAFRDVQDAICAFLDAEDGQPYQEDAWAYEKGSGGGVTRIWENAGLIEKGGVNYSFIEGGSLPASAATQFKLPEETPYKATGVSLVIHPHNPYVPTIHMNIRYFEAGEVWWFGGGIDLTPYYLDLADVRRFHATLKAICDECGEDYLEHKRACDAYFFLPHRNEARGVGGIFFDHLRTDRTAHFGFVKCLGHAFPDLYRPLVQAHRNKPFGDRERAFQLHRRARYVEFNLVYDRGTKFGLQSGGRIESILMSLPAVAAWRYNWRPEPGSPEAQLDDFLRPRDWLGMHEP